MLAYYWSKRHQSQWNYLPHYHRWLAVRNHASGNHRTGQASSTSQRMNFLPQLEFKALQDFMVPHKPTPAVIHRCSQWSHWWTWLSHGNCNYCLEWHRQLTSNSLCQDRSLNRRRQLSKSLRSHDYLSFQVGNRWFQCQVPEWRLLMPILQQVGTE